MEPIPTMMEPPAGIITDRERQSEREREIRNFLGTTQITSALQRDWIKCQTIAQGQSEHDDDDDDDADPSLEVFRTPIAVSTRPPRRRDIFPKFPIVAGVGEIQTNRSNNATTKRGKARGEKLKRKRKS